MHQNPITACLLVACLSCSRTPEPPEGRPANQASAQVTREESPPARTAHDSVQDLPGKRPGHGVPGSKLKHVIVVAMENHDAREIYEDQANAPYIHSLLARYAHALNFEDELPQEIPSEGHYVWMEAGTHHFSDALFDDDSPPSARVSTGSSLHLVQQIRTATTGISWMSYQE